MKCKKNEKSMCDGSRLREFFHSLPFREMRPMRVKIAEAVGVKEKTVMQWAIPSTYRISFSKLQKKVIEQTAGQKIF
ncbi:MAG: hypothetical protein K2K25_12305 [Muribaculaceae bacterium]|nr:hypothetical protein [Muribaculaceae bacterium]